MLLPYSTIVFSWEDHIYIYTEGATNSKQTESKGSERDRRKERKTEIRGEGDIIIPGINPIADVLLVLSCEGVACDPAHLRPNERLTDWLTSLSQCVCMHGQILLDGGPGNDLGAYEGKKEDITEHCLNACSELVRKLTVFLYYRKLSTAEKKRFVCV